MQKLTDKVKITLIEKKASALVGVVAITALLGIGATGLLQVTTSAIINETENLNDAKAFYAAETGLLLGLAWLNDGNTDNFDLDYARDNGIINGLACNGFYVDVKIENEDFSSYEPARFELVAEVYNDVTVRTADTFYKRLKYSKVAADVDEHDDPVQFDEWREENNFN